MRFSVYFQIYDCWHNEVYKTGHVSLNIKANKDVEDGIPPMS